MRLIYCYEECNSQLVPEGHAFSRQFQVLAELTKEPPKEGRTYLIPGRMELKSSIFRYWEGEFRHALPSKLIIAQSMFEGKPLVEFPIHRIKFEDIPPVVAQVITESPQSTRVIRPLLRQLGVPLPPEAPMTGAEWLRWIYEAELPLSPLAMKFLQGIEAGQVAYYDLASVPTSLSPNLGGLRARAAARRAAEDAMPFLNVTVNGREEGTQSYTNFSTWRGRVPVPLEVIARGRGAIEEHVEEWVDDHTDSGDYTVNDESTDDHSTQDFTRSVEEYGNIDRLMEQHGGAAAVDRDEDDDDDEEEDQF